MTHFFLEPAFDAINALLGDGPVAPLDDVLSDLGGASEGATGEVSLDDIIGEEGGDAVAADGGAGEVSLDDIIAGDEETPADGA